MVVRYSYRSMRDYDNKVDSILNSLDGIWYSLESVLLEAL